MPASHETEVPKFWREEAENDRRFKVGAVGIAIGSLVAGVMLVKTGDIANAAVGVGIGVAGAAFGINAFRDSSPDLDELSTWQANLDAQKPIHQWLDF